MARRACGGAARGGDRRVARRPRRIPTYACVWRPPAELFARVRPAKAIFNLGAGVDALLAVPTLPRDVPVVRLEDAGMAEQMAEYVTLAVLARVSRGRRLRARSSARAAGGRARVSRRRRSASASWASACSGRRVAAALAPFGFPLAGWSRTRKTLAGVRSYARPRRAGGISRAHVRARLHAAVDARDARASRSRARCRAARAARTWSTSRAATSSSTRTCSRCSTKAISPARRSTCSARSRCRRTIRSGIIRESR